MKPDPLFVGAGVVVAMYALFLILTSLLGKVKSQSWIPGLLWAVLAAGLLVQGFAPHLQIKNDSFVMSLNAVSGKNVLDPEGLVDRERLMQMVSAVLTSIAAIGLGVYYGRSFFQPQTRKAAV
jgi:hypothetical protein